MRKRELLILAGPFSVSPAEVKPLPKLIGGWMVYEAVATPLLVNPLATAMALIVVLLLTGMGPTYKVEEAVGVLPLVV